MPKIYIVVNNEDIPDNGNLFTVGAFKKLADARECFKKTYVEPWVKTKSEEELKKYFEFNPLNPRTSGEWADVLQTFNQNGLIEQIELK